MSRLFNPAQSVNCVSAVHFFHSHCVCIFNVPSEVDESNQADCPLSLKLCNPGFKLNQATAKKRKKKRDLSAKTSAGNSWEL